MRGSEPAYLENGFSPAVLKVLADSFCRHGMDMAALSTRLKHKAPHLAHTKEAAIDLADLCVALDRLSQRVISDAMRTTLEARKLPGGRAMPTLCRCGRTIEDGACPTLGRCARGITLNLSV